MIRALTILALIALAALAPLTGCLESDRVVGSADGFVQSDGLDGPDLGADGLGGDATDTDLPDTVGDTTADTDLPDTGPDTVADTVA
ncbi:MAG: hypothetical protein KC635_08145, partial [Myxococcales bacterium]|nr:hypothetical protein [Myxococcales bacterium]